MTPTTPADASPAAGEIVALKDRLRDVIAYLGHNAQAIEAHEPEITAIYDAIAMLDASRAETDAAKRERDNFRDGYRALGGLKYEVEIKLDAANARADRLARDLREMSVARAEVEKAMFARHNDCLAAEAKLAETTAELVRVREMLGKAEQEATQWQEAAGQATVRAERNEDRVERSVIERDAARSKLAKTIEALKPFSVAAARADKESSLWGLDYEPSNKAVFGLGLHFGDVRNARAILAEIEEGKSP